MRATVNMPSDSGSSGKPARFLDVWAYRVRMEVPYTGSDLSATEDYFAQIQEL